MYDALWYSLVTLSTVGYGDFYPVTPRGKIMAIVLVIGSLGVLSYIVGQISLLITSYMDKKKTGQFGTKLSNHFVIIGWDDFSKQVVSQIVKAGHKIAIITNSKNDVDLIRDSYPSDQVFVLFADYDNYDALAKTNIEKCSKVFINFDDDSKTLIHIINIQKRYKNLEFVVILNSQDLKDTFRSVGVTFIVSKNEIASKLVASYIFEPDAAFLTEDIMETSLEGDDHDIVQFKIIENNPFLGKRYEDVFLELKKTYNAVLMGISKSNQSNKVLKNPAQNCIIEENDYLILMADGPAKLNISKDFNISDGRFD
tara:strand:+ start:452 stop:1387 length:936 start_codon:yes stop_codon:yes gene_type:complete